MAVNGQVEELVEEVSQKMTIGGLALWQHALRTLQSISDTIPPWWSPARDAALDEIVTTYDHLGGILYAASTKLVNIPLKFVPKNPKVASHQDLAVAFTEQVKAMSGYGQGFREEYKKGIYDYLGSDNGMFFGVMGPELFDWDKPLNTMATGIRHLDSHYVQRTGNPLYPILYTDMEFGGSQWYYHFSRVIMLSQMPSSRKPRFGVGRSAMGRSVRVGQTLNDQLNYKRERMGSRPSPGITYIKGGEAADIFKSIMLSKEMMDNLGLTNYAMEVAMGIPIDGDLGRIRLNDFDLFDEEVGTTIGIFTLCYIWGIDPRDVWPMQGSKQGNETTNMIARGKLPAEFTQDVKGQFDAKLCPPVLEAVHDYQDDEEDQAKALNSDIRARRRERNAKSGLMDKEAERRLMVVDGDLSREEFIRMQLEEGKLEDGTPIATLFYSTDALLSSLLAIPNIENPFLYSQNDKDAILEVIEEKKAECYQVLAAGGRRNTEKGSQALAALEWLESQYDKPEPPPVEIQSSTMQDVEEAVLNDSDDEEE